MENSELVKVFEFLKKEYPESYNKIRKSKDGNIRIEPDSFSIEDDTFLNHTCYELKITNEVRIEITYYIPDLNIQNGFQLASFLKSNIEVKFYIRNKDNSIKDTIRDIETIEDFTTQLKLII